MSDISAPLDWICRRIADRLVDASSAAPDSAGTAFSLIPLNLSDDDHVWRELASLGLHLDTDSICLLGPDSPSARLSAPMNSAALRELVPAELRAVAAKARLTVTGAKGLHSAFVLAPPGRW